MHTAHSPARTIARAYVRGAFNRYIDCQEGARERRREKEARKGDVRVVVDDDDVGDDLWGTENGGKAGGKRERERGTTSHSERGAARESDMEG